VDVKCSARPAEIMTYGTGGTAGPYDKSFCSRWGYSLFLQSHGKAPAIRVMSGKETGAMGDCVHSADCRGLFIQIVEERYARLLMRYRKVDSAKISERIAAIALLRWSG